MTGCARSILPIVVVAALLGGAPAHADPARSGVGFERSALRVEARGARPRESTLFLWYPSDGRDSRHDYGGQLGFATPNAPLAPGRHPLVVFSHGYLGTADQSIFLTEALARAGYVVAGLDHADASRKKTRREAPKFGNPESWDDRKFRDRAEDLRFLVDRLLARSRTPGDALHEHVDATRIGAVGHSLGGYALLGIAGARPAWRDERIRAFVLLSPYVAPYLGRKRLAVAAPVMLQGGTLDVLITPSLPELFAALAPPKYYAVLRAENHFGWTNLACLGRTTVDCAGSGNPREMVALTRGFLDRHLRSLPAKRLNERGSLASYQVELR